MLEKGKHIEGVPWKFRKLSGKDKIAKDFLYTLVKLYK